MKTSRTFLLAVLVAVGTAAGSPAFAADVTSVKAPKRVKAGASAQVVASVSAVDSCRLTVGKVSVLAPAAGADRVTFTFTVSRTARPGRYTLTLRCGTIAKRVRMTVTPRKGKRGTSSRIVKGRIKFSVRRAATKQPAPAPGPTPVPTASPTPAPVVPGPGNSFRAVYALAADQAETPGYVAGILATIDAVNGWFATQTIGNVMPRWMRDATWAPQVTVVKLAAPAATYESDGGFERMRSDLRAAAPLAAPTQKSVVWMEVAHPEIDYGGGVKGRPCGVTGAAISWLTEKSCGIRPVAPTSWPADGTYLTAHEMAHNFGAVPDCAPHGGGGGHVNDDPRDLLYSGPLGRDWNNQTLDPGRDDYYGTGTACGDIAKSPFWTVTSDPRS